jgi:hypothetical protein
MAVLAGCMIVLMPGCSSNPPVAEVASANAALLNAQSEDATEYAPVAMDRARDKLRRAQQAMAKGKYGDARRLAEEAQADAELAQAVANKSEAEAAVREMEISIEVLREEIMRGQGL